jgi:hypothetical protein
LTGCIEPKTATLGQAAQKKLKARAKVKDGNYKERVETAGEIFYPVVSTCNGTLGEAASEFLKLLYDNRSKENELLTFRQLTGNFKRIIHSISAGALINAERVHGATHIKQVAHDEGDLPWHEAFLAIPPPRSEDECTTGRNHHYYSYYCCCVRQHRNWRGLPPKNINQQQATLHWPCLEHTSSGSLGVTPPCDRTHLTRDSTPFPLAFGSGTFCFCRSFHFPSFFFLSNRVACEKVRHDVEGRK